MPICVAGMHRSGTSMVANLLSLSGVYFGQESDLMLPQRDNPDGFFENVKVVELNERLLSEAGGGWDHVPTSLPTTAERWGTQLDGRFAQSAAEARVLIQEFERDGPTLWGWKDPRTSCTFGFWHALLPDLKAVICLRNPLEVAVSLHRRNYLSYSLGLRLWRAYYQRLLAAVPSESRLVTHYQAYLTEAGTEVRRLLSFLAVAASDELVSRCCDVTSARFHHASFSSRDLVTAGVAADVYGLYRRLCEEACWVETPALEDTLTRAGAAFAQRDPHEHRDEPMRQVDRAVVDVVLLQQQVEERTRWAKAAERRVAQRDAQIRQLEAALTRRLDEVVRGVAAMREVLGAESSLDDGEDPSAQQVAAAQKQLEHRLLVRRVGSAIESTMPADATALVISDGDDALVTLGSRRGWHFPQDADGAHRSLEPAHSGSAIVQIEALRAKGADHLVVPSTAFSWLDHQPRLREHLDRRYRLLMRRDDTCAIYDLRAPSGGDGSSVWTALEKLLVETERRFGRDPAILDWNTGLDLSARFTLRTVFSPPPDERPTSDSALPYLDGTVDIVAVASADDTVLAEARRVALFAVVVFAAADSRVDEAGGAAELSFSVRWLAEAGAKPRPSVSIIIPSYNGIALTEACIRALEESLPGDFRGEIIVVDDASTDDTPARLQRLISQDSRIRSIRNAQNLGFLATCNRGAQLAAGDVLVLLNNDTLPLAGWLEALLTILEECPDAGAVGSKLVYPDGRLQEAGGVVFSDGSAANFGRGDPDIDAPLYNYVREVDYVTGAVIATPRALFEKLGGLDPRYRPAYYEETDYCFRLREAGFKVYYQPASVVIHLEGATSGTDDSKGQKLYQVVNQQKFMERWTDALRHQPDRPELFDESTWYGLAVREERQPAETGERTAHDGGRPDQDRSRIG